MKLAKTCFLALAALVTAAGLFAACKATGSGGSAWAGTGKDPLDTLTDGLDDSAGAVSVDPEGWKPGDVVTITITAKDGYEIAGYSVLNGGGGSVTADPVELRTGEAVIPGVETSDDTRVVVTFARVYSLVFTAPDGNGTVTGTNWNDIARGGRARAYETVTFTASASTADRRLSTLTWMIAGSFAYSLGTASDDDNYSFSMPAADVTVSAGFAARNSYTVTFDKNGGDTDAYPASRAVESAVGTLPEPPGKNEYSFTGWNRTREGDGEAVNRYTPVSGDMTVYARWLLIGANEFAVGFDPSGGGVDPLTIMVPRDRMFSESGKPLPVPEKTGYDFDGWRPGAGGTGAPFTPSDTVTGPVTVYAKWTAKTSSVTFDANGGSGPQAGVTATYDAAMPPIVVTASRTGYTFIGYFDAANGGVQYYTGNGTGARNWDRETSPVPLYAQWVVKTSVINFNTNGGSGSQAGVTATYGAEMPPIVVTASRTGYTFTGYFDAGGGGDRYYTDNGASAWDWDKETSPVPLYAHWTPVTYTVTNGTATGATGTIASISGVKQYGQQITVLTEPAVGYKLASVTVYNEVSSGPTYDADGITAYFTMPAASVTVTAAFTAARFTLSFDTDGGGTVYPQTVDSGAQVSRPADPVKPDYAFINWYGEPGGGSAIVWPLTITADRTVYARWGEISVTGVDVSPAGGTVERGASRQFTAVVSGANGPPQGVSWELTGAQTAGTGISAGGLLTVAIDEAATALTVKATSTADSGRSGTADVTLEGGTAGLAPETPW
jgi:uncharacterized repeat protein (TIGR02543 family)